LPKLPAVSGRETIRALERDGFVFDHQEGSHVTMRHTAGGRSATVPVHGGRDLPPGTLRSVLRQAGLSVGEFCQLLEGKRRV